MNVENIKFLLHSSGFLKNMYHIINKKNLMLDLKWKPKDVNNTNTNHNINENFYSEVESGLCYKRTYEKNIRKHRINTSSCPTLLISIVLGQDATLCDKIGRVTSEPILVSISNIIYMKRKFKSAWLCLGFLPYYPKTQLESQKYANRLSKKEIHD